MKRAQVRDAVHTQKFFFRKEVFRSKRRHGNARNWNGGNGNGAATAAGAARSRESSVQGRAAPATHAPSATGAGSGAATAAQHLLNGFAGNVNGHARSTSQSSTAAAPGGATPRSARSSRAPSPELGPVEDEYSEFTMDELINGTKKKPAEEGAVDAAAGPDGTGGEEAEDDASFPGLLGLVYHYLDSLNIDVETRHELGMYLELIADRASGKLKTTATWIREFVRAHPEYRGDSVITPGINFDVSGRNQETGMEAFGCADLLLFSLADDQASRSDRTRASRRAWFLAGVLCQAPSRSRRRNRLLA